MAKCDYCGSSILFGGKKDGEYRFCNDNCHANGYVLRASDQIPVEVLAEHIVETHAGNCPKCGKKGPIDVQTSHTIWSALLLTSWKSNPEVCCRSCGVKKKLGGMAFSAVFGWWGFPWGIIITPIQITRNLIGLFQCPNPQKPSKELEKIVRVNLAARIIQAQQNQRQQDAEGNG